MYKRNLSKGTWVSNVMFPSPRTGMPSVTLKVKLPLFILFIPSVAGKCRHFLDNVNLILQFYRHSGPYWFDLRFGVYHVLFLRLHFLLLFAGSSWDFQSTLLLKIFLSCFVQIIFSIINFKMWAPKRGNSCKYTLDYQIFISSLTCLCLSNVRPV